MAKIGNIKVNISFPNIKQAVESFNRECEKFYKRRFIMGMVGKTYRFEYLNAHGEYKNRMVYVTDEGVRNFGGLDLTVTEHNNYRRFLRNGVVGGMTELPTVVVDVNNVTSATRESVLKDMRNNKKFGDVFLTTDNKVVAVEHDSKVKVTLEYMGTTKHFSGHPREIESMLSTALHHVRSW